MNEILTHSPFVFPEGTFLQRMPKLKATIFKILERGMVRDNETMYCAASKFLFRHSFNIKEPTWMDDIDGGLEFMPSSLINLPDHLQFSSFKEGVIVYVRSNVPDVINVDEYINYDEFLIENNLQYIPYEVLEYCYVLLGINIPFTRDVSWKIEKKNMYLE